MGKTIKLEIAKNNIVFAIVISSDSAVRSAEVGSFNVLEWEE